VPVSRIARLEIWLNSAGYIEADRVRELSVSREILPGQSPLPSQGTPRHGSARWIPRLLILAMVITVLVTILLLSWATTCFVCDGSPTRNIGLTCAKSSTSGGYRCTITSADTGVDFSQVNAQITTSAGEIFGVWHSGVDFGVTAEIVVIGALPPLAPTSRLTDQGDLQFGPGDRFLLDPVDAMSLRGLYIKLAGGGASGSAGLN